MTEIVCNPSPWRRFRAGPLIEYCLEVISGSNLRQLEPRNIGRDGRNKLVQALKRIKVIHNANYPHDRKKFTAGQPKRYPLAGLTQNGADNTMFLYEDRQTGSSQDMSVEVSLT